MDKKKINAIEPVDWSARKRYRDEKRLENSIEARSLEIGLFWNRSIFFWGFIASAFVGYATLKEINSKLAVVVACFGMVCSFSWTLLNRGSKYWQESWEKKVNHNEMPVTGTLFSECEAEDNTKGLWLMSRRFSVSRITIALSDYVFILSLSVVLYELTRIFCPFQALDDFKQHGLAVFSIFSLVYLYAVLICSVEPPQNKKVKKAKSIFDGFSLTGLIMARGLSLDRKPVYALVIFAALACLYIWVQG